MPIQDSTYKVPNSKAVPSANGVANGYCAEANAIFYRMSIEAPGLTEARKAMINNTIVKLKEANIWDYLDVLFVWSNYHRNAALIDWKNPNSRTAKVVNPYSGDFVADNYFKGNGTNFRIDTNFNPNADGMYNFKLNNNSIGAYVLEYVSETKIEFSAQKTGSIGIDTISSQTGNYTMSSKNNCASASGSGTLTGIGLISTQRTSNKSWKNYKNGYDLYGGAAGETDVAQSIGNNNIQIFCRAVDTTYSTFSTKKHAYFFAGSGLIDQYTLNTIIEENYLDKLNLVPRKRITFNGNSFTNTQVYVGSALDNASARIYDVNSRGISGQTTPEMLKDAYTSVFNKKKSFLTKDIFFVWELTNDMVANSNNATTTYNNMVDYCKKLRSHFPNGIIIVATCLPRINITDANRQNDANLNDTSTLNGMVRVNLITDAGVDAICDVASDLNMGQAGQWADTTYYNVDGIHPNNATGYPYIGTNYVGPSLTAVL